MSECGVSLSAYDDGANEFYSEVNRRAAKPHRCSECLCAIDVGDKYVVCAGKSDGDFFTVKVCEPCMDLIHEFAESNSWTFGDLWPTIESQWSHGQPVQSCINAVPTVAMKSKLLEQWRRYKGLDRLVTP